MSRYTGPRARISRRLGTNIFGTKGETVALDKRPTRQVSTVAPVAGETPPSTWPSFRRSRRPGSHTV